MNTSHLLGERLVALFLLAVLLLNPPLLLIFDSSNSVAQVPTLYLYLFVVWALLISLLAIVTEFTPSPTDDEPSTDEELQSSVSRDPEGA